MLNIFYDRIAAFPFFCPDRNMGKYVLTRKKPMMPRRLSGGRGIFILWRTDGTLGTFRTDGTRMRRNQKDFLFGEPEGGSRSLALPVVKPAED